LNLRITPRSLPNDIRLDDYVILKTLSRGGFSYVYIAKDVNSGERVVLKEYIPTKFSKRDSNLGVVARNEKSAEHFNHGRSLFLQEATSLAKLKHPNIVKVSNFFSANGTVYMVMQFEEGHNLYSYIKKHKGFLSEQFLLTVFPQLLDGLEAIHQAGFLHLDIKPGNVHLRPGGSPILLDFGAVHPIMKTRSKAPAQVVSPGFSPIEQYNRGYVGPWSDIYAVGATMRNCIDHRPPPAANLRDDEDTMKPASLVFQKHYSPELLKAIDWSMEIDPLLRPQSVAELLDVLPVFAPDSNDEGDEEDGNDKFRIGE